jgi:hypothetical protein
MSVQWPTATPVGSTWQYSRTKKRRMLVALQWHCNGSGQDCRKHNVTVSRKHKILVQRQDVQVPKQPDNSLQLCTTQASSSMLIHELS